MKIKAIHEIYYTGKDGKRAVAKPGDVFEPVGDMLDKLSKTAYSVVEAAAEPEKQPEPKAQAKAPAKAKAAKVADATDGDEVI